MKHARATLGGLAALVALLATLMLYGDPLFVFELANRWFMCF